MTPRRWVAGGVVAGVYLVAVVLTLGGGDTVRPVFDGFAPAPKYRWVDPPPAFAAGNSEPSGVTTSIPLGEAGTKRAGVATDDAQFVLALGAGAIAAHGDDRRVRVSVEPTAGRALRLPDGLRRNGNAYRVTMTYEPSGDPVTRLQRPGAITLTVPELSRALFLSTGGAPVAVPSRGVPPALTAIAAELRRPGSYVSGTDLPLPPGPDSTTRDNTLVVAVGVGVAALAAFGIAWWIVRRRSRGIAPRA